LSYDSYPFHGKFAEHMLVFRWLTYRHSGYMLVSRKSSLPCIALQLIWWFVCFIGIRLHYLHLWNGMPYNYSYSSIFETYGSCLMAARNHRQFSVGWVHTVLFSELEVFYLLAYLMISASYPKIMNSFFCQPIHILQVPFLVSRMRWFW